jgi:hypothetical protein
MPGVFLEIFISHEDTKNTKSWKRDAKYFLVAFVGKAFETITKTTKLHLQTIYLCCHG